MKATVIVSSLFLAPLVTLAAALPAAAPAPALAERDASALIPSDPSGPANPACWSSLSCTFAEIEKFSMTTRLSYVRYMQSGPFVPLTATNRFRAIEGVIELFLAQNVGQPGTWISYVDAGIVEAIQRGGAIALGHSTDTGGNPGSALWADYFRRLKAGQLKDRDVKIFPPFSFYARLIACCAFRTTILPGRDPNRPRPSTGRAKARAHPG